MRLIHIAAALGLAVSGLGACATPAPWTQSGAASATGFGTFDYGRADGVGFQRTDVVPLIPGQAYGWIMRMPTSASSVRIREELILPAPAPEWGTFGTPGITVAADRRSAVTEIDVPVVDGMISNSWEVAEGDPPGPYIIRVSVEGRPATVFRFRLR